MQRNAAWAESGLSPRVRWGRAGKARADVQNGWKPSILLQDRKAALSPKQTLAVDLAGRVLRLYRNQIGAIDDISDEEGCLVGAF